MEELRNAYTELDSVLATVRELSLSPFSFEVESRANEFRAMGREGYEKLFGELCFCILAANTSAEMALRTQNSIGIRGFLELPQDILRDRLKSVKYRFYNLRSKFIVQAREIARELPSIVRAGDADYARKFLVDNVMGIGYKEASHFLRNVGVFKFAILDKHIVRMLSQGGSGEIQKITSPKRYLEMERRFLKISDHLGMEPGILDLYMWKIATGKMIK